MADDNAGEWQAGPHWGNQQWGGRDRPRGAQAIRPAAPITGQILRNDNQGGVLGGVTTWCCHSQEAEIWGETLTRWLTGRRKCGLETFWAYRAWERQGGEVGESEHPNGTKRELETQSCEGEVGLGWEASHGPGLKFRKVLKLRLLTLLVLGCLCTVLECAWVLKIW